MSELARRSTAERKEPLDLIVCQVGHGDCAAFELLYNRMAPRLYRYFAYRGLPGEMIEEALQETFLAVWRDAAAFHGGSAYGWILGIARHKLADVWRQTSRMSATPAEAEPLDATPDPRSESAYLAVQARSVLAGLSASERDLAHLVFVEDLSYREVADVLGIPVGTVKSRVSRIRRHLQKEER